MAIDPYYRFTVRWPFSLESDWKHYKIDVLEDGKIKSGPDGPIIDWSLGSSRFSPASLHEGHARRLTVDFIDPGFDTVVPFFSVTMFIESSQLIAENFGVQSANGREVEDGD